MQQATVKYPNFIVYLLPLAAVFIWSINIVLSRYAIDFISPISISFYRWFIAWVLLTPFLIQPVLRNWLLIRPHLKQLAVLGLFGMVCYQGLAYTAAQYTSATNMGIINAFIPVFSIFLSLFILSIRPTKQAWLGVALSIIGLVYLIGQGNIQQIFKSTHLFGDLLMIVAVGLYACYGVFLQKWQLKLALPLMLYMQITFAVIFHLPLLAYLGLEPLNLNNYIPVVYAALFPSIVAPFVWMLAIRYLGSNASSLFLNFMPVFTAIIAYFFLQEQWTYYHTIGGILVLTGVLIAQKKVT